MGRFLVLILLIALLGAGEHAGPATPLRWAAGPCTLADAIGRLAVGGNTVWLARGIDDRQERVLPAVDGPWWDGVIALCQAFTLRPDVGDPSDDRLELNAAAIPMGHGGLVLSAGPLPGVQVHGAILIVAEATSGNGLTAWLRVEPHVARGTLAAAGIEKVAVSPSVELEPVDLGNGTWWRTEKPLPSHARLTANLQIAGFTTYASTNPLAPGKEVEFTLHDQTIKAMLITDPALDAWEGATLPERRPLLAVVGPQELLQRSVLRMRQGTIDLPTRGSTSRGAGDGRLAQMRFLRALPAGAIDLIMEGRQAQTPDQVSMSVVVPPAVALAPTKPVDAPSQVRWDAGSQPMSTWITRLSATGNPVLPEVGIDTRQTISVPAVQGGFWEGVLAVCRVSGLRPAMPQSGELAGGAVRLVRGDCAALTACGPLLLGATTSAADQGTMSLAIGGLLEPRLLLESFGTPEFRWASWASEEDGTVHPLDTIAPEQDHTWQHVSLTLLRPGVTKVRLQGLVGLPRISFERASLTLDPDEPVELLIHDRVVEVTAVTTPRAIGGNVAGPGILLRGLIGCDNVDFSIIAGDGQPAENGSCMRLSDRMGRGPFIGRTRGPPTPGMQVEISAKVDLPELVLPVSLEVQLPDRR